MINIPVGLLQVILLVLHYGHFIDGMPWWVVWFPSLFVAAIAGVWLVIVLSAFLIAWAAGGYVTVDKSWCRPR